MQRSIETLRVLFKDDPRLVDLADSAWGWRSEAVALTPAFKAAKPVVLSRDAAKAVGENIGSPATGDAATTVPWSGVTDKPLTFPPSEHTHTWGSIADKPLTFPPSDHTHTWDSVTDKPLTFPPSDHTHTWGSVTDKPLTFPPSVHEHLLSEIDASALALNVLPRRNASGRLVDSGVYDDGFTCNIDRDLQVYPQSGDNAQITVRLAAAAGGTLRWAWGRRDDGLSGAPVGAWVINDDTTARVWGDQNGMTVNQALTVVGKATFSASTTTRAGFNLGGTGVAPATPADGDVWRTASDVLVQLGSNTETLWHTGNLVGNQTAHWHDWANITGKPSTFTSGLTTGRVPFVTTGSVLTDSPYFTYSDSILTVAGANPRYALDGISTEHRLMRGLSNGTVVWEWGVFPSTFGNEGWGLIAYNSGVAVDRPIIVDRANNGKINFYRKLSGTGADFTLPSSFTCDTVLGPEAYYNAPLYVQRASIGGTEYHSGIGFHNPSSNGAYLYLDSGTSNFKYVLSTGLYRQLWDTASLVGNQTDHWHDAYQPVDSDLTAIAALSTTAYGRGFLTQADAASARSYIGAQESLDLAYFVKGESTSRNLGKRTTLLSSTSSSINQLLPSGFYDGLFDNTTEMPQTGWWCFSRIKHSDPLGVGGSAPWGIDFAGAMTAGNAEQYLVRVNNSASWGDWRTLWHSGNLALNTVDSIPVRTSGGFADSALRHVRGAGWQNDGIQIASDTPVFAFQGLNDPAYAYRAYDSAWFLGEIMLHGAINGGQSWGAGAITVNPRQTSDTSSWPGLYFYSDFSGNPTMGLSLIGLGGVPYINSDGLYLDPNGVDSRLVCYHDTYTEATDASFSGIHHQGVINSNVSIHSRKQIRGQLSSYGIQDAFNNVDVGVVVIDVASTYSLPSASGGMIGRHLTIIVRDVTGIIRIQLADASDVMRTQTAGSVNGYVELGGGVGAKVRIYDCYCDSGCWHTTLP